MSFKGRDGELIGSSWDELGIKIPPGQFSGETKTECPACQHTRRKNPHDKPLSVNLDKGIGNCKHCGQVFIINRLGYTAPSSSEKEYKKPDQRESYDLIDKNIEEWFKVARGISLSTLRKAKVTSGNTFMPQVNDTVNTIQFNYFDDNELINVKYRDLLKNFRLHGGAKVIFYNLNALKDPTKDYIIITEGEIDALSFIESDRNAVVSVPNGSPKQKGKDTKINMEYLNNHYDLFDDEWRKKNNLQPLKRIILATDNDEPGIALKNEFIRRFGAGRCYQVNFGDCKDANEFLIKYGSLSLSVLVDGAVPVPMVDVITVSDLENELNNLKKNGLHPGAQVGSETFQKMYSFEGARLTIVTGVSTHGKSEYLDDIATRLAVRYDWKFAVFSPENFPIELHVSKLVSKITGKEFNDVSGLELKEAYDFIKTHFIWIYPSDDNYTLDNILAISDSIISRYGTNALIIDPWTEIDKQGQEDTEGINKSLSLLSRYKRSRDVHVFLVAHPTKLPKDSNGKVIVPDLMNISGSANFYNKTDGGITVYRNFDNNTVDVYVNKVKFKHLGRLGMVSLVYNLKNGRYEDESTVNLNGWDDSNWLHTEKQQELFVPALDGDDISPNTGFYPSSPSKFGSDLPF